MAGLGDLITIGLLLSESGPAAAVTAEVVTPNPIKPRSEKAASWAGSPTSANPARSASQPHALYIWDDERL
jgi:hypothetical protein